jgi:hypothetical protein
MPNGAAGVLYTSFERDGALAEISFHPKNRSWGLETLAALRQAQGERLAESLTHRVTTRNSVRAEPVEA